MKRTATGRKVEIYRQELRCERIPPCPDTFDPIYSVRNYVTGSFVEVDASEVTDASGYELLGGDWPETSHTGVSNVVILGATPAAIAAVHEAEERRRQTLAQIEQADEDYNQDHGSQDLRNERHSDE